MGGTRQTGRRIPMRTNLVAAGSSQPYFSVRWSTRDARYASAAARIFASQTRSAASA